MVEYLREPMTALWWVPAGHRPTVRDAEDRVRLLRAEGPNPEAFTLQRTFPASDAHDTDATDGKPHWLCPA